MHGAVEAEDAGLGTSAAECPSTLELLSLLKSLRQENLLPCICFHCSAEQQEQYLLGIAHLLEVHEKAMLQATKETRRGVQEKLRIAWEQKCDSLRQSLAQAEERALRARGRTSARLDVALGDDERAPAVRAEDAEEEALSRGKQVDVSGDAKVRAIRAALQCLEESGPPEAFLPGTTSNGFVPERPKHVYGTEIGILLARVEAGIRDLGRCRGKLWAQAVIFALQHGIGMHFEDDACVWMNLAVQLLFRLGHVQVMLAGEALGCGVNLPCRTTVILDSKIRGAMLAQMAGRAGRRGFDLQGATVFVHDLATLRCMRAGAKQ